MGLNVKMTYRSVSLKRTDSRTVTSESPKRMILHKSLSFRQLESSDEIMPQNAIAFENHRSDNSRNEFMSCKNEATMSLKPKENRCSWPRPKCELDAAAVKLQKVYKSYRTRRNLADCAVVVEELWWKALDFASLKHNSLSFFNIEKQETAVSRWSRARNKAAKVGKGMSRDEKARQLALQHWLEAIDPRHRYGHNLHFYYDTWFYSESTQPFFYWLDVGDGREVKQKSVSFFNVEKQETAVSRWTRALTKAAKVGKGLSKDEKARQLALRHWLEAIDPRHRYGHNLHFYYDTWFDSESTQPFFYWLDVGDGREVNLEKCPRNKLQRQFIKYLGPIERESFEVIVENGKLIFKQSEKPVNTSDDSKWIFVLSTTRTLYVGQKKKGTFQHSSFLAGGATTAAGRLVAKEGTLLAIWPYSGHYLPTEENFKEFISFLEDNNVDLTTVKRCSVDDDDYPSLKKSGSVSETEVAVEAPAEAEAEALLPKEPVKPEYDMAEVAVKAFELTKRLSCKWTTGTGPRIGCVRDYPSELQFKALEQVNLSPRVIPSPSMNKCPIPSPRPSPKIRLSPRLAYMGIPSPRVTLTLPTPKRK